MTKAEKFATTGSLAELMIMATDDMEALLDNDIYDLDSEYWHYKHDNSCRICMAGAIMANRLDANIDRTIDPSDYDDDDDDISRRLYAIDSARKGDIHKAYDILGKRRHDVLDIWVGFAGGSFYDDNEAYDVIKFWRDEGIARLKEAEYTRPTH